GAAQIDTSQYVFNGASGAFGKYGGIDYLTVPDSASWNYGTSEFTIDFRVRFRTASGMQCLYHQPDSNSAWDHVALFYDFSSRRFYLYVSDADTLLLGEC
ncbi:MAG: hypothetical protein GWN00_32395, partial [Aliifodinibius sp.]|nr:hypothetical protein [Fodinibius sp.]NIY29318.1 hypothetical protein [Fodinibius sp.]